MDAISKLMPDTLMFICMSLAFLIPYFIYKVNQKLHEHGDPPWKKEEQEEEKK